MTGAVLLVSPVGVPAGIDQPRLPALIAAAGERAGIRFLKVFASTIRNPHTLRADASAVADFRTWCEEHAAPSIAAVQPLHVAAWMEGQTREHSAPTVKQQLAAIRRQRTHSRRFWVNTSSISGVSFALMTANGYVMRRCELAGNMPAMATPALTAASVA